MFFVNNALAKIANGHETVRFVSHDANIYMDYLGKSIIVW